MLALELIMQTLTLHSDINGLFLCSVRAGHSASVQSVVVVSRHWVQ